MNAKSQKRSNAINKEIQALESKERKLEQAARKQKPASWKTKLEGKIPEKVYSGLESAFCKGFSVVFSQGRVIIEKSYNKEEIKANHAIRDYAVQLKGGRKELKQMHRSAKQADLLNLAVTTVEGVGLGVLGIGMPDIVLFLSTLLKGIYETALNFGFEYDTRREQFLILKMMEASLCTGEQRPSLNAEVDCLMATEGEVTEEEFQAQMKRTASVFAMDMLLLKFIQGLPVIGVIGGAANPVYYRKIMKYVQLKYTKRYLLKQKEGRMKMNGTSDKQTSPYMSTWATYGMHRYRRKDEDSTVYYIDDDRCVRQMVVDKYGNIRNFPGIKKEEFWVKEVTPNSLKPQIRFRTDFVKRNGRIMMLWQIQPDGRYWEDDDGFGAEHDEEVTLYAFLTEDGKFDGPFRIYEVGMHKYYEE